MFVSFLTLFMKKTHIFYLNVCDKSISLIYHHINQQTCQDIPLWIRSKTFLNYFLSLHWFIRIHINHYNAPAKLIVLPPEMKVGLKNLYHINTALAHMIQFIFSHKKYFKSTNNVINLTSHIFLFSRDSSPILTTFCYIFPGDRPKTLSFTNH